MVIRPKFVICGLYKQVLVWDCTYNQSVLQVRQLVAQHYPTVEVIGTNYPIEPFKQFAADVATTVRNIVLVTAMAGDTLLVWAGAQVPGWYTRLVQPNRFGWLMGEFMDQPDRSGTSMVVSENHSSARFSKEHIDIHEIS